MRTHGLKSTYGVGCRCAECTAANTAYIKAYCHRTGRHRPQAQYLTERYAEPPPHGTESRYSHHRCRCDDCKRASREARARRHAKVAA